MSSPALSPPFYWRSMSFLPTIHERTTDLDQIDHIDDDIDLSDLEMLKLSVDQVATESEKPSYYHKIASIYFKKMEHEKAFDLLKNIPLSSYTLDLYADVAMAYSQRGLLGKVLKEASSHVLSSKIYEAELIKKIFLSNEKNEEMIRQILEYIEKRKSWINFDQVLKELFELLSNDANNHLADKAFGLIQSNRLQEILLSR